MSGIYYWGLNLNYSVPEKPLCAVFQVCLHKVKHVSVINLSKRKPDVSAAYCINDTVFNIIIGVCVPTKIKIAFTCATTVRHALITKSKM